MKIGLALLVIPLVLGLFTGCEPVPTLPRLVNTVKGYNDEIHTSIVAYVSDSAPESFNEGSILNVDDGRLICTVASSDVGTLYLRVFLNHWVARDGTQFSGNMRMEIQYYTSSVSISRIHTYDTILYFDRTFTKFESEVSDESSSDETFTPGLDLFNCLSLIVNGDTLITNSDSRK